MIENELTKTELIKIIRKFDINYNQIDRKVKRYNLNVLNEKIIPTSILKKNAEQRWKNSPSFDIETFKFDDEEWCEYSKDLLQEKLKLIIDYRYKKIHQLQISNMKQVIINSNKRKSYQNGKSTHLYLDKYYELGLVEDLYETVKDQFNPNMREEKFVNYSVKKLNDKLEEIINRYSEVNKLEISTKGRAKINGKFAEQIDEFGRTGYLRLKGYGDLGMMWTLTAETWLEKPQGECLDVHHLTNDGYNNSVGNLIYIPRFLHRQIDHKIYN